MINESKKYLFSFIILLFFLLIADARAAFAASGYVLPYPSVMPGGISYKIHLLEEKLLQFWYFGDFGQFTYNLKESDKYLVEAKILFEYNQYLLGFNALKKSDAYFTNTWPNLIKAKNKGESITSDRQLLKEAAQKHIEVLTKLKKEVPSSFTWTPEKALPTNLNLNDSITNSIKIRNSCL